VNVFNGANLSLYCEVAYALGSDKPPRPPRVARNPQDAEIAARRSPWRRGAVQPGSVPKFKPGLPVADGDEPRVTPAPTDTPARLARSEGAVKALSGQLSCAPTEPDFFIAAITVEVSAPPICGWRRRGPDPGGRCGHARKWGSTLGFGSGRPGRRHGDRGRPDRCGR